MPDMWPTFEVQFPAVLTCCAAAPLPTQRSRAGDLLRSEFRLRAATAPRKIDPVMHPAYEPSSGGPYLARWMLHGSHTLRLVRGSTPQTPASYESYIDAVAELVNPAILLREEVEAAMGSSEFADAMAPYEQQLAYRGFEIAAAPVIGVFRIDDTAPPGSAYPLTVQHHAVDGNGALFELSGNTQIAVRDAANYTVELECTAFSESTDNPTDVVLEVWDFTFLETAHTVTRQSADPLEAVQFQRYVHRSTFASDQVILIKNGGSAAQRVTGRVRVYQGSGAVPP